MPTTRYQLLSPWPEQALAFTTSIERVARSGNRATLTELARRMNVTRPSASETASHLCDVGYLSIGRGPGDRRFRQLKVTEAGKECLSEVDAGIDFLLLEMTNDIQVACLVDTSRVLDRMARRLSACETVLR